MHKGQRADGTETFQTPKKAKITPTPTVTSSTPASFIQGAPPPGFENTSRGSCGTSPSKPNMSVPNAQYRERPKQSATPKQASSDVTRSNLEQIMAAKKVANYDELQEMQRQLLKLKIKQQRFREQVANIQQQNPALLQALLERQKLKANEAAAAQYKKSQAAKARIPTAFGAKLLGKGESREELLQREAYRIAKSLKLGSPPPPDNPIIPKQSSTKSGLETYDRIRNPEKLASANPMNDQLKKTFEGFKTASQRLHERYRRKYDKVTLAEIKPARRITKKYSNELERKLAVRRIAAAHGPKIDLVRAISADRKHKDNPVFRQAREEFPGLFNTGKGEALAREYSSPTLGRKMDYQLSRLRELREERASQRLFAAQQREAERAAFVNSFKFNNNNQAMMYRGNNHRGSKSRVGDNDGPITELTTLKQSTLPTVLTIEHLKEPEYDGRQLVAKHIDACKQNTRDMLRFAKEILILAESDFSFSASLVEYLPRGCKMIATSFESEEKLQEFHKETFTKHMSMLDQGNVTVFHEIDAMDIENTLSNAMRKNPEKMEQSDWSGTFDIVWLQLPHTGGTCKTNSNLIKKFLACSGRVLKPNGMVYLTLYGMQVAHWKVPLHAEAARMNPVLSIPFGTNIFPSIWQTYQPRVGFSDTYFDILRQPCDTLVFVQNEFTPAANFSAITPLIAHKLSRMGVLTIADLSILDRRLQNRIEPGLQSLIMQAKMWFHNWGTMIPRQINALATIV